MSYSIYYLVKYTKKSELNSPAFEGGRGMSMVDKIEEKVVVTKSVYF
jgi:hypothetical protein